ncbi:FAD-binding oxidoreductase [Sinorhizobium saheli]|uniref:FAD-linked oxidase n=1 Tax=Sinorhizobium saheli TaxID=36856 RepID=A0A178YTI8_SINSA|nr:FAD-binding oxidoreductase [Sinorhizobium saheli]MQW86420.1 FAD-binding protein [Sinorhizobium saheli]OAP50496.1 FAD-linked oxidase [Sinorhizobium saheli]
MKLSGWGRFPVVDAQVYVPRDVEALQELVASKPSVIARGCGRAYGDSAINSSATIDMRRLNRMLGFDPKTGQLIAEAGVVLCDIIAAFLPRGWFPMVTPGTKFVTLGGMIAADVHGKNHRRHGSFRGCVDWIEVMGADGSIQRCSRESHVELFEHTLGGMGLTGIILRAAVRLRAVETGWIRQTTIPAPNLRSAMTALERAQDSTYSVAWIDCLGTGENLGRSLVFLGDHASAPDLPIHRSLHPFATPAKRKLSVPFNFPCFALNRFSLRTFNSLYYRVGAWNRGQQLVDWDSYFYPLDAVADWHRIYGRKGLAQFQCALPLSGSEEGLSALLQAVAKASAGSFLAVLKRFGPQESRISFPMEGYSLALDFPITAKISDLLANLDRITIEHGGRFYLAKDSRMSAETLRASDDRVGSFVRMRAESGWKTSFQSAQAERLVL